MPRIAASLLTLAHIPPQSCVARGFWGGVWAAPAAVPIYCPECIPSLKRKASVVFNEFFWGLAGLAAFTVVISHCVALAYYPKRPR